MAAQVQVIEVSTPTEVDAAISSCVVQGYVMANRTPTSATMVKRKEFSALWAVIGFLVCVIPLLIYLIMYAAETDKVVEIRVSQNAALSTRDSLDELERLKELHTRSVITDEEFEREKRRLLGSG